MRLIMMNYEIFQDVISRFESQSHLRIVAFGASNTERHMPQVHWTDVLEVGLRSRFGRKFQMINAGVCGDCTRRAMKRFERDVLTYAPDIVIITFGGNDCNPLPERLVPEDEYAANLTSMAETLHRHGAIVIFQSYYKMILEDMDQRRADLFVRYMERLRLLAAEKNWLLVDQYRMFDRIERRYRLYNLMRDPMHVNENGNILIGLYLSKFFDVDFNAVPWREKLLPMHDLLERTLEKK